MYGLGSIFDEVFFLAKGGRYTVWGWLRATAFFALSFDLGVQLRPVVEEKPALGNEDTPGEESDRCIYLSIGSKCARAPPASLLKPRGDGTWKEPQPLP